MTGAPEPTAVHETHLSVVLLRGDRAWKFPKPVRLPFVDQSTPELRQAACTREVDLNRRLAPDVYLGVLDLVREGEVVDHAVEMRRMPADRRLATLACSEACHDEVRDVARTIAAFHGRAATSGAITDAGSTEAVRRLWEDNLDELVPFAGPVLDPDVLAGVRSRSLDYLAGREPLLAARQEAGLVRDGHGDLLADDIFCLPDGPRILDCLAFDDRLRHGDVLLDLAFLAMDLEQSGRPDLSDLLVRTYRDLTAEHHPDSLAHHFVAYRALVRAKVACLRVADEGDTARDRARGLLDLCLRHLEQGTVRLVLVGGTPGTGKSTLARALAGRRGWSVLDSDELRKDLAGLAHDESAAGPFEEGLYAPEVTDRVYGALLDHAARLLAHGESVVLDASWTSETHRERARRVGDQHRAAVHELCCVAPAPVVAQRLAARAAGRGPSSASDAGAEVADRLAAGQDPWPAATDVPTTGSAERAADLALAEIDPAASRGT